MRSAIRLAVLFFASLLAACAPHLGTRAERTASFAPFEEAKIGDELAWDYLLQRTGWVVSAEGIEVRAAKPHGRVASARVRGRGRAVQFGTAAAIDSRGYFLTAAHNLQEKPPFVAFYHRDRVLFLPSRAVWVGNERQGEADLAILHVGVPLDAVFAWGDAPKRGDTAFSAGLDAGRRFKFQLVCMAGPIDSLLHLPKPAPGRTLIFHRTPLHPGDSGGPLVSQDGRLLGINTEIYPKNIFRLSPFTQHSAAQRTEPAEIRRRIEEDAAARRGRGR